MTGAEYQVVVTPVAERALKGIASKADRRRVDAVLALLDTVPDIGRVYDPLYEAARPPRQVMVFYAGHYGIYYHVDDDAHIVTVLYLEDQRRNPLDRFAEE